MSPTKWASRKRDGLPVSETEELKGPGARSTPRTALQGSLSEEVKRFDQRRLGILFLLALRPSDLLAPCILGQHGLIRQGEHTFSGWGFSL